MEQPPSTTPESLAAYLVRVLTAIHHNLSVQRIDRLTNVPAKPVIGKVYYFNNVVLPSITVEGYWGYKSTGWVLLG